MRAACQCGAALPPGARSVCLHGTGKINRDGSAAFLKSLQHSAVCLPRGCRALGHAPRGPDIQGQRVGSPKAGSVLTRFMADAAAHALPGDRWVWLFISRSERARQGEGCNVKPPQAAGAGRVQPGVESLARKPGLVRRDGGSWWQQDCGRADVLPWPQRSCSCWSTQIHVYFLHSSACWIYSSVSRLFMHQSQRVSSAPTGTRAQPRAAAGGPAPGKVPCTIRQDRTGRCVLAPCMTAT